MREFSLLFSVQRLQLLISYTLTASILFVVGFLSLDVISPHKSQAMANTQIGTSPYLVPVVTPSPFPHTQPRSRLPEEPDEFDQREVDAFYDWRNDMFFRRFDMTGKGIVDFMTRGERTKFGLMITEPHPLSLLPTLYFIGWISMETEGSSKNLVKCGSILTKMG